MAVLGIEGTAHTLGVGVVERDGAGKCRVLANERAMLAPAADGGPLGIHPREAAHHHADKGPALLEAALAKAGLARADLEAVAFSQGPGLGPSLRVAATMARALSLEAGIPLVGVNHCVAHLEIARGMTPAQDPVLLYVSGANTQVLAFVRGRYRVFGETLDVGLGNALDKFARGLGIPFPGGPEVERLAAQAPAGAWHDLPYVVKGMDTSFAGLATAAARLVDDGVPVPEACLAFQEHAFAMLVEVAERALAHTGRTELALGGGVACNARLQAMARAMCDARGAAFHCPPREVLVDNGAMIAWLGLEMLRAGATIPVAGSQVLPEQRTDQVDARWRAAAPEPVPAALVRGAEAIVTPGRFLGLAAMRKARVAKAGRHPRLDARIRDERTRDEASLLAAARRAGVPVPLVLDVDRAGATLELQAIPGETLRAVLARDGGEAAAARLRRLGGLAARLHDAGLAHGDLTTSNVLVPDAADPASLVLIDFGLGQASEEPEPRGVDLHLVEEALEATDARSHALAAAFLEGYAASRHAAATLARLAEIRARGRYK
ncbi:MAG: bifunctional N6-L-threonylcarbamoyladenine synthase / protein kinase Bud32 [Thermoplasmata archaeon]|jgi:N6-L-threonylcarbamoyladenine synthase/protein kinase Bud32|nr:bifunctional N6-L-threonylcarbamoyladenine synthase / protein kinase Bud32 [Thermoplasmata archaeon]